MITQNHNLIMNPSPRTELNNSLSQLNNGFSPSQVIIEGVQPAVNGGRFAIKRVLGESVRVTAHIHTDGHQSIAAILKYRQAGQTQWQWTRMRQINQGMDLWEASFVVQELGQAEYTVEAWIDDFAGWRKGVIKKVEAGFEVPVEQQEGAIMVEQAVATQQANPEESKQLELFAMQLRSAVNPKMVEQFAQDEQLNELMFLYAPREPICRLETPFKVQVEPVLARFGSWYELFPRSMAQNPSEHGTLKDVIRQLPRIAEMGFDVLYMPPIHPIGFAHRKGPNNTLTPSPQDPGCPWAIGAETGGHDAILPELGTFADFEEMVNAASSLGIKIALDIAFQCSPDHPYVKDHPDWFIQRPDGSIQYAENPPKKYQDIYPINFACADWQNLWNELKRVIIFWIEKGVTVFRVDNPHTKPYAFWEWLIAEVKQQYPETIFLSEAFTRPKVMQYLAKAGFSQSYTYFTWRNTQEEITEYLTELTQTDVVEYFRPNFFANTPDILTHYLQTCGPAGYKLRAILAGTLSSTYGIYGPVYEFCIGDSYNNTEEYLDSEKYQVRHWDFKNPKHDISDTITALNRIRKDNVALQQNRNLKFHAINNEHLIAYTKQDIETGNLLLIIVNLDPHKAHSGWVTLNQKEMGLDHSYNLVDLLNDRCYTWHGATNYVHLDPKDTVAHIFKIENRSH